MYFGSEAQQKNGVAAAAAQGPISRTMRTNRRTRCVDLSHEYCTCIQQSFWRVGCIVAIFGGGTMFLTAVSMLIVGDDDDAACALTCTQGRGVAAREAPTDRCCLTLTNPVNGDGV